MHRSGASGSEERAWAAKLGGMIERETDITTLDGVMKTFIYHPQHDGPSPVVLYLMDAPSIRPVLKDMAMRLASAGYYVMLPYLYYRGGPFREFGTSDEDMHARADMMRTIDRTKIVVDARALLDVAADDPAARSGPIGAVGFCMSGPFAIALAKAMPDRVAAAASIHGAWLVTDQADSTHLGLDAVTAELYFGWPDNDQTAPPETVPVMRAALEAAGVRHTIDFLTDAVHGYAPAGTPRYNRDASELHWERVHSLLRRNLARSV
jgi:carboxymethylenebutenolidase